MFDLDFSEMSFWEVSPSFLPVVDEIVVCEGSYFILMAVAGAVTHQSPALVANRLIERGIMLVDHDTRQTLAA